MQRLRLLTSVGIVIAGVALPCHAGDLYGVGGSDSELLIIRTEPASWNSIGPAAKLTLSGMAYHLGHRALYAVSSTSDQLYRVDQITGQATPIGQPGDLGFDWAFSLAFDSAEQILYSMDALSNGLFTVDAVTGKGTLHTFVSGPATSIEGLAFDPMTQTLFGLDTNQNRIVTIDPDTGGSANLCGELPDSNGWAGLSFDPDVRRLYVSDGSGNDKLYEVDQVTGVPTFLGELANIPSVQGMAVIPRQPEFDLLGLSWDGDAYRVDEATGTGELIGPAGTSTFNALAQRTSDGLLIAFVSAFSTALWVDPETGEATGYVAGCESDIRSAAFAPDGALYVATGDKDVYRVELSPISCDSFLIGQTPVVVQGMEFAPDGTLYGWTGGFGLITIDPVNAEISNVNGENDGGNFIQSLTVAPDGKMYGIHNELYEVDAETGQVSLIGAGGFEEVRGLAWVATDAGDDPLVADLNDDSVVDAGDLAILLGGWGPCEDCLCPGDLDEDLVVNAADLAILLANWSR